MVSFQSVCQPVEAYTYPPDPCRNHSSNPSLLLPGIDRSPDGTRRADTHANCDGDTYSYPDLHRNIYSDFHLDWYHDPDCHLHRHPYTDSDPYINLHSQPYAHPNMDTNPHVYRNSHPLGNEYAVPASHQHSDRKPIRNFSNTLIHHDRHPSFSQRTPFRSRTFRV